MLDWLPGQKYPTRLYFNNSSYGADKSQASKKYHQSRRMPGKEEKVTVLMAMWALVCTILSLYAARRPVLEKIPMVVVIGMVMREAFTWLPFEGFLRSEPTLLPLIFASRAVLQILDNLLDKKFNPLTWDWIVIISAIVGIVLIESGFGLMALTISWAFAFFMAFGLMLFSLIRRN